MKALVIIDLQNDFMPGGPLGVPGADQLATVINALIPKFPLVVASQDWHPPDHGSFASNHPGKKLGDVDHQNQLLWPVHCVRDTPGAKLVAELNKEKIARSFYKGTEKTIDSYSAFFDNLHLKSTGLGDYLKSQGVTDLFFVGVATDYCVLYTALDALDLGFSVFVIADACRPINLDPKGEERALAAIVAKGGKVISSGIYPFQLNRDHKQTD
jgi:nicotinamidase/pyrazinamidase